MRLAIALRDLPARDGVGASRVVIPPGQWACVMDFLVARFPHISAEDWQQRLAQGLVLGDEGQPLQADTPTIDGGWLYYYRAVESETAIPFRHQVLYRDAHLLVVDKPHFLPVIPSGKYLQHIDVGNRINRPRYFGLLHKVRAYPNTAFASLRHSERGIERRNGFIGFLHPPFSE